MLTYAIRRLVLSIPTLLFISFVIFMLLQLAPGDPMALTLRKCACAMSSTPPSVTVPH